MRTLLCAVVAMAMALPTLGQASGAAKTTSCYDGSMYVCGLKDFERVPLLLPDVPDEGPEHGHLLDLPELVDADGIVWPGERYAFLAIKLPVIPGERVALDYVQELEYLVMPGYVLRSGGEISRTLWLGPGTEWAILRLNKPCQPGETETDVGLVTVCPPRENSAVDACLWVPGVVPIYVGVPPETVPCPVPGRQRALRR